MLRLLDIHKDYYINKKPLHVLKGIDLSFPKQQYVTILGPSGCGKTTLLNLIGGLDKYTSGDLIIDGKSTKEFKDADWDAYRNHRVGFVFQSYNLIAHLNVLENVEISLTLTGISTKERRQKAISALVDVGLEEEMYKKTNQLSGGQMQRVAIARAMVNDPSIILADEPTGALDTKTSSQVLDILKEVSKTRLVIMVSHNEQLAKKYSDRIVRMVDGKITSDSQPDAVDQSAVSEKAKEKRTAMSFFTALRSSYKNILTKKGRTFLTALAGSLGIIGIGLVLAVSSGLQNYIDRMEQETMASYPLAILAQTLKLDESAEKTTQYEKYPEEEEVYVYNRLDRYTPEYNIINKRVIDFTDQLIEEGLVKSTIVNYPNKIRVIYEDPNGNYDYIGSTDRLSGVTPIPSGNFSQLPGDEQYIMEFYDLLGGENARFPENEGEVVLALDAYNRLTQSTMIDLGFAIKTNVPTEPIPFESFLGREFKAITNNEFFSENTKPENKIFDLITQDLKQIKTFSYPSSSKLGEKYNDDSVGIKLTITGILRPKHNIRLNLVTPGIAYTQALNEQLNELNKNNEIGKAAINNFVMPLPEELDRDSLNISNMFKFYSARASSSGHLNELTRTEFLQEARNMGALFEDLEVLDDIRDLLDNNNNITANERELINEMLKEMELYFSPADSLGIFPADAASKKLIKERFEQFNDAVSQEDEKFTIELFDAVELFTDSLASMVEMIATVLIIFISISLVVSGFLIGIITYVSVIERTKEIGILRSLGARKIDISRLFNAETFIIGFLAGTLGVLLTYISSFPLNVILNNKFPDEAIGNLAFLPPFFGLILIAFNVLLTVIAGLIPSLMAANKDPVVALRTE